MPVVPAWHQCDGMLRKWDLVTVIRLQDSNILKGGGSVPESGIVKRGQRSCLVPGLCLSLFLLLWHVVTQSEGCFCVQDTWSLRPPVSSQTTHK